MANLVVRDVPDDVMALLRERARAHGRSVEAEHREILCRALRENDGTGFEDLAAALRALTAGRAQTPAEVLLRAMRDER